MNKKFISVFLLLCLLAGYENANAAIKLPGLIGDHMILQRDTKIPVWGWATKNSEIELKFNNKIYKTKTGNDGKWIIRLKPLKAGGPYDMNIKGDGSNIYIKDILIGDVWICSGQSNMAYQFTNPRAKIKYADEIANAQNDRIRQIMIEKKYAVSEQDDCKTYGWKSVHPQNTINFSSVAYFFAKELYEKYQIPIGLISSNWGGTKAEAWTSEEGLKNMSRYNNDIFILKTPEELEKKFEQARQNGEKWDLQVEREDKGYQNGHAIWAAYDFDDSNWETMPQSDLWDNHGYASPNNQGAFWYRKEILLPQDAAGKDGILDLGGVDDIDYTYFNGQLIGQQKIGIRRYKVPASLVKAGKNIIAVRIINNRGRGGLLDQPRKYNWNGNKNSINIDGAWKFKRSVKIGGRPGEYNPYNMPTALYNGMISPLKPYAFKGVIWYQGESNTDQAYEYRELFPAMIKDWRKQWGREFPFLFVQLANFKKADTQPQESDWAELREAQSMTLQLPKTAMSVIIDLGEADDIHPVNKEDVGKRLALAARKTAYGEKGIVASGPTYKNMKIKDDKIILFFENIGNGLTARNGKLKQFAIAGADKKFVWADAVINGNTVIVSSPSVKTPIAVRYAWSDNPEGCNLYNSEGLPTSPFRTDHWDGKTKIKYRK